MMQMQKHHSKSVDAFLLDYLCCILVKAVYCSKTVKNYKQTAVNLVCSDSVNFNWKTVSFILS